MAGMKGYDHRCDDEKIAKSEYKKALKDSKYSYAQIDMIWDFFVTHCINGNTAMARSLSDYGWENNNSNDKGSGAIEKKLFSDEFFEQICFIRAKTCKETLNAMNLSGEHICIFHPRAVLLQNYEIKVDENEIIKFGTGSNSESKISALFRHIRNSFAHANTYFFDNGMVLLEDKNGKSITASLLLKQQTLLDWIRFIDRDERFYVLIDTCSNCKKEN